jgi:hypothetical protein
MFSGPDGEVGYGGPQTNALSWTMPDGTKSWYVAGTPPSQGNVEALQNARTPGQAIAPGDFGSLKGVCGPGKATGATAQGVTDTSIDVGTMSDPANTMIPGINQDLFDTSTAFVKWCNDAGGIAGRKINVHLRDGKLFAVPARMIDACAQDFSLVGGGNGFDDAGVDQRIKCGLPDLPAFNASDKARDSGLMVQVDVQPTTEQDMSLFQGALHSFPGAMKAGYLVFNVPGAVSNGNRYQAGATKLGYTTVFNEVFPALGMDDPLSYVQRMKAANVDVLMYSGDASNLARLEKAMQTAGWYPKAILASPNLYDKVLIADGGDALKNTWVSIDKFPFELASKNGATKQYLDIMATDDPSGQIGALGLDSWNAWLLFATSARDCGSDLTRACLLSKASSHADWTGGGLTAIASTSATNRQMAECYMDLQATASGFVQDPGFLPANSGSFNCSAANVIKLP